ncbi:MAG: MotA/TolQ/ExbB proton channel family protein [Winogradskyella sp.]|nr:MotA/TolQ/ExbB proton channel family protein [Winogradskyella sp.]
MNELVALNFLIIRNDFTERFSEGGPFFMTLILICLLLSIFLLINGFLNLKKDKAKVEKMLKLTVDSSLLGLVLGFFASVIGLITAFDSVEAMGDPDPAIFAGGLKVSLLTATFGLFSFVISRIGILILRWSMKAEITK